MHNFDSDLRRGLLLQRNTMFCMFGPPHNVGVHESFRWLGWGIAQIMCFLLLCCI